ncbi:MAG: TonB-dependent receptor, partial [Campylobacterales bacterium]|nr:TonB-dependent receptor [Campylobacterales bacterium]
MKKQILIGLSVLFATKILADTNSSLGTITITAQKTEENLQQVPISMDVYDSFKIEDYSISTLEDIGKYTSNLMLFNTGQQGLTSPSIRGIAASVATYSTPVSLYVDGVPTMSSFGYSDSIEDIERIEVLKGPQGTFYGKNSEAGVINVITKKPDNQTKGKIFSKFGNNGKLEYGINFSGPIIKDKFYGSIGYKHNEKDGFIKDSQTGEKINNKENDYGKINLRFTPNESLDISIIGSKSKNNNGAHDWAKAGQTDNITVDSNLKGSSTPTIETLALSIDYKMNEDTKIKSISTKRTHKDSAVVDNDLSSATVRHFYRDYKFETVSQEVRLEKRIDKTNVVTGLYFDKSKDDLSLVKITTLDPTGGNSKPQTLTSKTYSVFTNVIHPFTNKWTINTGIR